MDARNQKKIGRYQLLALLATGGMAEIYLARQEGIKGFERLVVIKKILPHLARRKRFVEMFFDEARIAALLSHPNIVQIYDLGQDENDPEGSYYIAMEYLEGESLGYLVKQARKASRLMPSQLAAGIVAQVCDGLDYAHKLHDSRGKPLHIVHRDVSPHNIIVLFSGGVKLVDFGIAKAASQVHQTREGSLKGKLTYIAPEQCESKPVDARSDVFSMGVVLWELLTRRRLFKRDSDAAKVQAIMSDPIPRVRDIQAAVSPELESIAQKALQRDAAKRFKTAGEMGAAIREHLRRMGAAAGVQEIAAFVQEVFGDRARTKKRLLEEIKAQRADELSLGVLKPETEESLPSRSQVEDSDSLDEEPTPVSSPGDIDEEMPTHKMKSPLKRASPDAPVSETLVPPPPGGKPAGEPVQTVTVKKVPIFVWVVIPALLAFVIVALFWKFGGKSIPVEPPPPPEQPAVDAGTPEKTPPEKAPPETADVVPVKPDVTPGSRPSLLAIRSRPSGCRVEIDGVEVFGQTPIERVAVEPDTEHVVTVLCPGHSGESKRVKSLPGEWITLDFAPPVDAKPEEPKPPKPKIKTGTLRLDTVPWSEVFYKKRKLGMTPLLGVKLPEGTHKLKAVNAGRGLEKIIKVTIKAGKTTTLKVSLSD